jgi:hypothetical protein
MLPAAVKRKVRFLPERLQHIFRTLRHGGILLLRLEDHSTPWPGFPAQRSSLKAEIQLASQADEDLLRFYARYHMPKNGVV